MQPSPHLPALHTLSALLGTSFSDQLKALLDGAGPTDLLRVQLSLCSLAGNGLAEQCEKSRPVVVSMVFGIENFSINVLIQPGLCRPCERSSGK